MQNALAAKTLAGALLFLTSIGFAHAQAYPNKRITIFSAGPGGAVDVVARMIAQGIGNELSQSVVVENRPAGVIPNQTVAKAAPDGYTLLYSGASLWITPLLTDVPYDPIRDFAPIAMVHDVPQFLIAHQSVPANSIKELIAYAKANPGKLNFGTAGPGGASTIAAEMFNYMAEVNIVRVPYKAGGARVAALLSGEIQLEFATGVTYPPHIKAGKVKALGVTTERPVALLPGVPAIADTLPGYESSQAGALFAPAKTPVQIVNLLNQEVVKLLNRPDTREKFTAAGMVAVGNSPEQLAGKMKSDIEKMGKLIKATGMRIEGG